MIGIIQDRKDDTVVYIFALYSDFLNKIIELFFYSKASIPA